MSQPVRLRDDSDAELRELMRYTQAQGAPSEARIDALTARVLAQLAAPGSEPPSAGAALSSAAKWLIGAALILTLGAVAYRWTGATRVPEPARKTHAAVTASPDPRPQPAPIAALSAEQTAPHEPLAQKPEAREQTRTRAKPLASKQGFPSAPAKPADLSAEVALLQRARRVLPAEPQAALALAAQHRREHPAGMFAEEREAIAVEALWRTGDVEQATTRLRALLLAYPRSTYRERLTTLLERPVP
jgi:hypothetical protein